MRRPLCSGAPSAGFGAPLVLAAAMCLLASFPALGGPKPGATVTVGLRYDDFTAISPEGLEKSILAACARNGIPCTFGVVPAIGAGNTRDPEPAGNIPLGDSRKAMISEAVDRGILEIALHGYAHQSAHRGWKSEFKDVSPAMQSGLIAKGKAELEAFAGPIRTFIPPWNSYDGHTLQALSDNGFTVLSADPTGPSDPSLNIRHVPATCLIPDVKKAVEAARRAGGGIVIPYFHPYEFMDADTARGFFTLAEFEATLAWLAVQPDVQTLTLSAIAELPDARTGAYLAYSRFARLTPPFLEPSFRPAFRTYPRAGFPVSGGALWLVLALGAWYGLMGLAGWMAVIGVRMAWFRRMVSKAWAAMGLFLLILGVGTSLTGLFWASFPASTLGFLTIGLGLGLWRLGPWIPDPRTNPETRALKVGIHR